MPKAVTREAAPGSVAQGSDLQNVATAPTGAAAAPPASTAAAAGPAPPPLSGQYVLQQQLLQQGGAATAGAFGQQAYGGYPGYPPPQFGSGPAPHHQYGYQQQQQQQQQQQSLPPHGHGPQPPYGAMPPGYPQYPFHGGSALTHPGQYPPPPGPYPTQQQQQQAKPSGAPEGKPDGVVTKNDGSGAKGPSMDGGKANGAASVLMRPLSSAVPVPPTSAVAAAAQGTPENKEGGLVNAVEPMRQDFHFYALDMKDSLMAQATETVKHAVASTNTARQIKEDDQYLVMTNLNERLIASWQVEPQSVRLQYLAKEEADRKRFQLDDEVASRHCATLTARSRSPKASRKGYGFTPPESYAPMQSGGDVSKKRPAPPSAVKSGDIGEKKSRGDDTVEATSRSDKKTEDKLSATADTESEKLCSDDKGDAKAPADSESKKIEDEDESDDRASDNNETKKVDGDGDIDAKGSASSEAKKAVDDDKSDDKPSSDDEVRKVDSDAKVPTGSEAKEGDVKEESQEAESDFKASNDEAKKGESIKNAHLQGEEVKVED